MLYCQTSNLLYSYLLLRDTQTPYTFAFVVDFCSIFLVVVNGIHSIKQMVDFGLKITIETDDILLFGNNINDEYLKLYNNNVLSAEQLDYYH